MAKHGIENFEFQIIETWDTQEEVNDAEIFWIEFLRSKSTDNGYNIDNGGYTPRSEETKRKLSKLAKERWKDPEYRRQRTGKNNAMYGVTGDRHPCFGVKLSKKRIRAAALGRMKVNFIIANKIRQEARNGCKQKDLAIKYSISDALVSKIVNNKVWLSPKYC